MNERILIVDDEQDICDILQYNLQTEGYTAVTAASGEEALAMLSAEAFDLVLLDVMMEGISGFDVARKMKEDVTLANIPIIFCTAKTEEKDVVDGFSLGSDDYITKPFRLKEVKARVKAVLRRSSQQVKESNNEIVKELPTEKGTERYEGLVLDTLAKTCTVDGVDVPLTRIEFELLLLLLQHRGNVLSRDKILDTVWPSDTIVLDRTVDVNITRLRRKIGEYGKRIRTRFGYGYTFER